MGRRVLLVEDEKNMRTLVAGRLRERGFEVLEAADGDEAWEKATTASPDVVVLDARLPRRTGVEVCSALKADERWQAIPVLMLSAMSRQTAVEARADAFLAKPFKLADVVAKIEALLAPAGPGASPAAAP
jgi:DNA-binding response OmpR family regulator